MNFTLNVFNISAVLMRVFDVKKPDGVDKEVNVVHFNSYYKFHGVWVDSTYTTAFTGDESYLVLTVELSVLVATFKFFDLKSLKLLCNCHGIEYKRQSKAVLCDIIGKHPCGTRCSSYVYVFKCLTNQRTNVLDKFAISRPSNVKVQMTSGDTEEYCGGVYGRDVDEIPSDRRDNETSGCDLIPTDHCDTAHLSILTDQRKIDIIREWQMEMHTDNLILVTCAVCSIRVSRSGTQIVDAKDVNLDILNNRYLPGYLLPTTYDLDVYRFALLNPKGLEFKDRLGRMIICLECIRPLTASTMPKFALANWLYYGHDVLPVAVKKAFDEASVFERMLVCRARSNSIICRFNSRGTVGSQHGDIGFNDGDTAHPQSVLDRARRGIRGNVIVTPLDTMKMNKIIPPPASVIRDTMCAIFVGKSIPNRTTIKKYSPVLVRRTRVETMIQFLLQCNMHYRVSDDFKYSPGNLKSLVDGGDSEDCIPVSAYIGQLHDSDALQSVTSDYTSRNVIENEDDDAEGDLLMENVAYTDGDHSPFSYQQMKNVALERCLSGKPFVGSGSGTTLVPDFRNESLLTWLFPHLDPWGIGGFHHPRRSPSISLIDQLRHLLLLDDRRFESDNEFAFAFYNVHRKSTVSQSLRFSVPVRTHVRIVKDLLQLDPEVVARLNASCEKDPYYKPVDEQEARVFRCLSEVRMVSKHVPGSDGYKTMLRNEIRGLMNFKGAPTLFITLNPSDVDNPIVRLLSGENICLEDVTRGEDMNKWKRSIFAAKNPSACARFFDLMITKFIELILRYGKEDSGIYGRCTSYYGTVEAQGKGTLHCHMLVWLEGHLSPGRLRDVMTSSEDYKDRFFAWVDSIIKCQFPNSSGVDSQRKLYPSRILHHENGDPHPGVIATPLADDYASPEAFRADYDRFVETLLHHYGWHEHTATCWKYLERGQEKSDENCRVGMNGVTHEKSHLDTDSLEILLRRHHPRIAAHTDVVLFLMKCNMDIKYIASGDAANTFVYYVTDYITKSSLSVHVGMAVLLHAIEKLKATIPDSENESLDRSQAVRAITTAVNSMMGRQEISHPQVMSYIVGGGDHYKSDKFALLQWGSIKKLSLADDLDLSSDDIAEPHHETTMSLVLEDKAMHVSNQQLDYMMRSDEEFFEKLCLYDFAGMTLKVRMSKGPGRHQKGMFLAAHPQYSTHCLVRSRHFRIPVLLGPRISNPNRSPAYKEDWCRDLLLLFKPWRNTTSLKEPGQTWSEAYTMYEPYFSRRHRNIASNMLVTTECADARDRHRERKRGKRTDDNMVDDSIDVLLRSSDAYDKLDDDGGRYSRDGDGIGPESNDAWISQSHVKGNDIDDETYILLDECYPVTIDDSAEVVSFAQLSDDHAGDSLKKLSQLMADMRKRKGIAESVDASGGAGAGNKMTNRAEPLTGWMTLGEDVSKMYKSKQYMVADGVEHDMALAGNEDQLRAFWIIATQILEENTEQLLMHVSGVGGTGKSHLIKSIVLLFERLGIRNQLILGAPTGIAAVLIGGQTLHSLILATPQRKSNNMSALSAIWRRARMLVVDEVSMIGAKFMSDFGSRVRVARGDHILHRDKPFGGMDVIFFGDMGQLKPPKQAALYSSHLVKDPSFPESRDNHGINAVNGAFIWRQFTRVVELTKNQRHAGDAEYAAFLNRLRVGKCIAIPRPGVPCSDLEYVCTRMLSKLTMCPGELEKFWDAPIIVGTKALRDVLNLKLIKYHSQRLRSELSTYFSHDIVEKSDAEGTQQRKLWDIPSCDNRDAFGRLPLFVGMKVMVTENLAFDNGIVNGSEGVVIDIRYSVDICNRRYAKVVYVKIPGCGLNIEGLDADVVPIFPVSTQLRHQLENMKSKYFTRKQIPLVPAYAYTDFKAQGRTTDRVMVDLATARGQGVYVMLSRVRTLSGLVILRWFPPNKIYQRLPEELRDEMERLEGLNESTRNNFGT